MKILILGAVGQVSQRVRQVLKDKTENDLVLYARDATQRIHDLNENKEQVIDGDFHDADSLKKAMEYVDLIFLDYTVDVEATKKILNTMDEMAIHKLVAISSLGIYDELPESFNKWNRSILSEVLPKEGKSADIIEESNIDAVIIRPAWMYNDPSIREYEITQKGETFKGTQVTREAVADLVLEAIQSFEEYKNTNIGVSEPNTDGDKPLFMQ
ncbi:NAD(P)H-binding protein [Tetragenococcus muriaticus]|uniref:NAD(P)H-binding protein n=1 Tax=Tetragenococcus muriaticus TaxID=64642 RepID=UPI00056EC5DF|nr:NAD(P)H-binding protein [Tetragenococcus muriaticus]